jgi:hypothetical protein
MPYSLVEIHWNLWGTYASIFRVEELIQVDCWDCTVLHLRRWYSSKSVLPLNCAGRKTEAAKMVTRYCSPHFLKTVGDKCFMWHSHQPLLIVLGYSWFFIVWMKLWLLSTADLEEWSQVCWGSHQ